MQIADIMPEKAGHGTKCPGMTVRLEQWAIERQFTGIETKACPRLLQSVLQIMFTGDEIERASLALIAENEIEQSIEWCFLLFGRELAITL